jgi:hypothetical protein
VSIATSELVRKHVHTVHGADCLIYHLFSYHQKYRLRGHGDIVGLLQLNNEELKDSTIAARLNGYLGQNGSKKQFDAEVKTLNLTPDVANAVRKVLF